MQRPLFREADCQSFPGARLGVRSFRLGQGYTVLMGVSLSTRIFIEVNEKVKCDVSPEEPQNIRGATSVRTYTDVSAPLLVSRPNLGRALKGAMVS